MDQPRMESLLATTEGRLKRSWLAYVAYLREHNSEAQIAARISAGQEPLIGVTAAAGRLAIGFHGAYIAAGQAEARWLDGQLRGLAKRYIVEKKLPVFDPTDPPAMQWAAQNRLDLIREIETETRILIRDILMEGARTGANPLAMARDIRESIGLTSHQEGIIANYRRELQAGDYAAALRRELSHGASDRTIAAALRAERAMTPAQIETAVERYRQNWIDMRARTIARTEGLRVAHQGSEELYRQAVERGDLEADQIERTWVHAGHSATFAGGGKSGRRSGKSGDRPFHVSMNGQVRGFGELFVSGIGGQLRFPGDPEASAEETLNCKCVLTTRIRPSTGSAQTPGMPGGGAAAEEEIVVTDEAALEEEAAAAEEQASALAEAEQAALEEELAVDEAATEGDAPAADETIGPDLAELLDQELAGAEDVEGLTLTPQQHRHQQIQQAQQRLATARAELARIEAEHAAAESELAGFQIGVGSIGDARMAAGIAEPAAPTPLPRIPGVTPPAELAGDPFRTAPAHDALRPVPSSRPAPPTRTARR